MAAGRTRTFPLVRPVLLRTGRLTENCESDRQAFVRPAYSARELRDSVVATAASTRWVAESPTISAAPSFAPGPLPSRSPHYHRGTPDATSGRLGRGERAAHPAAVPGSASGSVPSTSPRYHAREAHALPSGKVGARLDSPAPAPSGTDLARALVVCARCRMPVRRNPVLGISYCEIHGLTEFVFITIHGGRRA